VDGVLVQEEEQVALSEFVLVDLGQRSFLEPVSNGRGGFRVTQYDPRRMTTTHSAGRHRYLIARSLLEADVVVNLPKLKTHRKAGMTGALKNLVGINGNKEFLPHHRVGGSAGGGDCYPGRSVVKRTHEWLLDCQNSTSSHLMRRALNVPARACSLLSRLLVDELGIEGAWAGNDTVWRMCLDLNRILLYARSDGTLADVPQRRVLHIVDGVIAGQGDGPLAAERFALHALLASESGAAVDLVGASLLGYDWRLIPIVREAFGASTHQLAGCAPEEVVTVDASTGVPVGADSGWPQPVAYPLGWLSAVRSAGRSERPIGRGATRLPLEA
jgi:hypothetical protein